MGHIASVTDKGKEAPKRAAPLILWLATVAMLAACSNDDRAARRAAAGPSPDRAALLRVASVAAGERQFARCAACHAIRRDAPDRNGPTLFGVVGAPVAGVSPRFGYTAALQRVGGRWTPERLDVWLADPRAFAPGTSMGFPGLADPLDRADVIAYLQAQR
jgi:cytochrome c